MGHQAIFTHNDLDGLVSALLARVVMPAARVYFCEYGGLPSLVQRHAGRYDEIWLSDLSIRDDAVFTALRESEADVYWFDHHDSSVPQEWMVECRIDTSGQLCAADVVRQYVEELGHALPLPLQTLSEYAHDQDLWIREIPEAQAFNDILGHMDVQRLFDLLDEDLERVYHWTPAMTAASEATREARRTSLVLAEATSVWGELPNGKRIRAATCWGSVSEVGDDLGDDDTLVVLLDLRSVERGVVKFSFRTQANDIPANRIAEVLGGGGHPNAAGAPLDMDVIKALSRELLQRVVTASGEVTGDPRCV